MAFTQETCQIHVAGTYTWIMWEQVGLLLINQPDKLVPKVKGNFICVQQYKVCKMGKTNGMWRHFKEMFACTYEVLWMLTKGGEPFLACLVSLFKPV